MSPKVLVNYKTPTTLGQEVFVFGILIPNRGPLVGRASVENAQPFIRR